MKINKRNPKHWLYLCSSGIWITLSLLLRPFFKHSEQKFIGFYGHQFNGNLAAIYLEAQKQKLPCYYFLLNPKLAKQLRSQGINAIALTHWQAAFKLAKIHSLVTDHGLHTLIILQKLSNIRFFDAWHGVPFKGFGEKDFKLQQKYHETWVTSDYLKKLYINKFKFPKHKVKTIGYARTDTLVNDNNRKHIEQLKKRFYLPNDKTIWLFAPTWKQDTQNRNIFPFNQSGNNFLNKLHELAEKENAHIIFRTHLNSNITLGEQHAAISQLPASDFPDTEAILLVSDILICDWSSIAFDFLLLDRPTLFLDTPPPFNKGFSLDEKHRFGKIVDSFNALLQSLESLSTNHNSYWQHYEKPHRTIKQKIYGKNADGCAGKRALLQLKNS